MKFVPDQELERFFNFKWYHFNAQSNLEWDTLIVLPQSKMIINIEVKSGSTINAVQSAADQTNRHLSIFKKVFGPLLSKKSGIRYTYPKNLSKIFYFTII